MSKFDWDATDTHYFVDQENKMMLSQNYSWNPNGSYGKGDAIGRSKDAFFAYGDRRFIEGVKNCWVKMDEGDGKYWYKGHRYPTPEFLEKDMSRDHTSNTFVLMKLAGEEEWLKETVSHIKWVITKKHVNSGGKKIGRHCYTPALWAFAKSFLGKWWALPVFYTMSFLELILYHVQNGLVYLMGWFSRELHQEDYNAKRMARQRQSKWRQTWAKLAYPIYALNLFAWQLFVLKDNPFKRLLQYMSYLLIPRHNYYLKLMFNVGKVTKEQVLNYKSMKGGRWTTPLNELNDRDVFIIEEKPYADEWLRANVLDKDLLIAIWNYRNPDDMIE